jgi:2-hydroxy-6-oxonona-2,4-dienedioate hydrolase
MEAEMGSQSIASSRAATTTDRYRDLERALWDHYGLAPTERSIEVASPKVRLRVVEVGSGPPILFVPGTAGVGPAWGALVAQLSGYRSILIDRPGWGLSERIDYSKAEYRRVAVDVLRGALESLGLDQVPIVGGSVGGNWALRLAQVEPSRVSSIVILGAGPLSDELGPPKFFQLLVTPIGAVIVRLPSNAKRLRSILTGLGHGPSLAAGRIPDAYLDWRVGFDNLTGSMANERDMVRTMVAGKAFRPGITFGADELARIETPTLMVYGDLDQAGSVEVWSRFVGHLPNGRLMVVKDGGHLPWLDDPEQIGARIRQHLVGAAQARPIAHDG